MKCQLVQCVTGRNEEAFGRSGPEWPLLTIASLAEIERIVLDAARLQDHVSSFHVSWLAQSVVKGLPQTSSPSFYTL